MDISASAYDRRNHWGPVGRCGVFILCSTSIASLIVDFYGVLSMRTFVAYGFLPSMVLLLAIALADRVRGDRTLCRAVFVGLVGGLIGAIAYDIFRLPIVFAREWGLAAFIPSMNLFKVFPRFGAMILGQPLEQSKYSLAAQCVGWMYHFSNGATFGAMYVALIGDSTRRYWGWAVLFASALEAGMLLTPYPVIFNIPVNARFIFVTMTAHGIFGLVLGVAVRFLARRTATH